MFPGNFSQCISSVQSVYAQSNSAIEPSLLALLVVLAMSEDTSGKQALRILDDATAKTQVNIIFCLLISSIFAIS